MLPSSHPVIEAVTQPFAENAELKLSAIQILEESLDPDHPSVPEVIEQLEKQDKKKGRWIRKSAIWVIAVIVIAFTTYSEIALIKAYFGLQDLLFFTEPDFPALPSHLTTQEKLLLGDPRLDEMTQKQLLFESDPNNPAYFAEYACAYKNHHRKLPDDFLETAARIDPENSFFLYLAAGELGAEAIEQIYPKRSRTTTPAPRYKDGVKLKALPRESEYMILDQTAYDEALKLIEQASQLPKFDNYSMSLMIDRMRLIPRPNTYNEYIMAVNYQFSAPSNGVTSMIYVCKLLEARAVEFSKKGEKEDYVLLTENRDALVAVLGNSEYSSLIDVLVYRVVASATAINFQAAADRLGLTEPEEKYRKQNEAFIAERDLREIKDKKPGIEESVYNKRGSSIHRLAVDMVSNQVHNPPNLEDSDLKPLRMVEHELMGGIGVSTVAQSLLVGALFVFLFRFLATGTIRLTAKRFAGLLKFSDWLWIASLGVIVPILAFLYLSRVSPVSGRDYGMSYFLFLFPSLHLTVLLLNLLFIPAVITRWRLKRRAAAFRFGSWLDWLALPVIAVMLVYSIAAYPAVVKFPLETPLQIALAAPVMGWLAFVFFHALRIFLGSARSRIIQCATAIAVLPAYALAAITLCCLVPIYKAGEQHWVPQDTLILIDPDAPDLGAYEFRVAAQKRREINEILGF